MLEKNGIVYNPQQVIETHMIFGGIPFYLNLLNPRLSLAQNVDSLCFNEFGSLRYELGHLFSSLFTNYQKHFAVIKLLSEKKSGLLRGEIIKKTGLQGEMLSDVLNELEECGFIRRYTNLSTQKSKQLIQLIDPFTLFAINCINNSKISSWLNYINSPSYFAWAGNAFEIVCLNNIKAIKNALGIAGVESNEYSFTVNDDGGAQIDLLIDRKDGIINLCEMKYSIGEFVIDKEYEKNLRNKIAVFKEKTKTKSAIHLTFVTTYGVKQNQYSSIVQNEIKGIDLL